METAKFRLTDGLTEKGTQVFIAEIATPEMFATSLTRAVGLYKLNHPRKAFCFLHAFIGGQWSTLSAQGDGSTIEIRLQNPVLYCDRNAQSILECWADEQFHYDRLMALCGRAVENA